MRTRLTATPPKERRLKVLVKFLKDVTTRIAEEMSPAWSELLLERMFQDEKRKSPLEGKFDLSDFWTQVASNYHTFQHLKSTFKIISTYFHHLNFTFGRFTFG